MTLASPAPRRQCGHYEGFTAILQTLRTDR